MAEEGLERTPDEDIFALAQHEGRIVLAFDLDFGFLLASSSAEFPSVIHFRLRDQRPQAVVPRLLNVIENEAEALLASAIIIVEEGRNRVRRLPVG